MMRAFAIVVFWCAAVDGLVTEVGSFSASVQEHGSEQSVNPIRHVVKLLQGLSKRITEEGENEQELYHKFMCYCKKNRASLAKSISEGSGSTPQVQSDLEESESKLKQLKQQHKAHKADLEAAKDALEAADKQRKKQKKDYLVESGDLKDTLSALNTAIPLLEKGAKGSFLQTSLKEPLLRAAVSSRTLNDDERSYVASFLSGGSAYVPQGKGITGMLKVMKRDYETNLAAVESEEQDQVNLYVNLKAAKTKEEKTLREAIMQKSSQFGELQVSIAEMKGEIGRGEGSLSADRASLAHLESACKTKTEETMERKKTRNEELVAVAETIKILNSDDALELFKKSLPKASLLQVDTSFTIDRQRALAFIRRMPRSSATPELSLLTMALEDGSADSAAKVSKKATEVIHKLLKNLKREQANDASEKEFCERRLKDGADKLKNLRKNVRALRSEADEKRDTVETMTGIIKSITSGIEKLDKTVKQVTAQRKQEHQAYMTEMQRNGAAKDLLGVAKERLAKFYKPKQNKAAKEVDTNFLSTEELYGDRVYTDFLQVSASETGSKVMTMLGHLVHEVEVQMTEAKVEEERSQKDYEETMSDSEAKRAADVKSLTAKQDIKADAEEGLVAKKEAFQAEGKQKRAAGMYMKAQHKQCDWLLANYKLRETGRAHERENLEQAANILAGAK